MKILNLIFVSFLSPSIVLCFADAEGSRLSSWRVTHSRLFCVCLCWWTPVSSSPKSCSIYMPSEVGYRRKVNFKRRTCLLQQLSLKASSHYAASFNIAMESILNYKSEKLFLGYPVLSTEWKWLWFWQEKSGAFWWKRNGDPILAGKVYLNKKEFPGTGCCYYFSVT